MADQDADSLPPTNREIRDLLEEIKHQNVLLRRYLFVYGLALSLLLLMQIPGIAQILQIVIVAIIVVVILLTAPVWSKLVSYLTDRLPWFPRRQP
ncbi:MAG TPA: hypothetical protein VHB77_23475 [Planctomycetaceae bacterium]|nr:hypothetical protein [Planctomycetaceae bacterium]